MLRSLLVAATLALTLPALAQEVNTIEGFYSGSGEGELSMDLTHLDEDRYAIDIGTLVPMENDMPGCAGGISGEVLLTKRGGNFFVENEDYDPNVTLLSHRQCEIAISFDGKGGVTLEEKEGCLSFHGAACGFSGTLTHDAGGI